MIGTAQNVQTKVELCEPCTPELVKIVLPATANPADLSR
jgi:hypothetical protein